MTAGARADEAITRLRERAGPRHTPGLQYVVVSRDGAIFEYVSGMADIRDRAPVSPATTMMAYSMSKTITAAAVLRLAGSGRLDLDAAVASLIDGFPYGGAITVRHLITHTSGIPNPIPLRWVHPADAHTRFDEADALATVLTRHPRPSGPPGRRYAYSNIGYWLLGRVVEKASGEPFVSYVTANVLRAIGAAPGDLGYEISDPSRHATGYLEKYSFMNLAKRLLIDRALIGAYDGRWLRIASHYPNGPAFGGLVGSARGFGMFLRDQLAVKSALFDDATRQLLLTPQRFGGFQAPMTLGWHIEGSGAARVLYKEGGGGGFHSMMRLYPDAGIGTVAIANATGFGVRACLDAVDPVFVSPYLAAARDRRSIQL